MAKASKRVESIVYILELTQEEIQFVADVMSRVSGYPTTTRRGISDRITSALREVGIRYTGCGECPLVPSPDLKGGIFCR